MKRLLFIVLASVSSTSCKSKSAIQSQQVDNFVTRSATKLQNDTHQARESVDLANQKIREMNNVYQDNQTENK